MRSTTKRIVPCLIASALVFAACGSSDAADDATDTADSVVDDAGDTADSVVDDAGDTADSVVDDAGDTADSVVDEGSTAPAGDGETLKVGTKYDQPLFGVDTPSGVEGFDADIARYIGEQLGRPVEFQEAVSANRETFLETGQVDMVVATYTINDDRDELIDFAGPYYVAGQDIMVLADNPKGITGIDDLNTADIKTCTVEGSTSLENLNEMAPDADVTTFDTYSLCADAMGQGRVDAVTTDNVILLGLADASGGEYTLVENPFTDEPYGIGVPEGSELRCEINAILQEMYDDGTWAQIYEDTVGVVASVTPEPPALNNEGC